MQMILATDMNGGIGINNKLPWHLPEDLKRFKGITIGKTVVMGRKTFESLPFKNGLPKRKNIVLTRNKYNQNTEEVLYVDNIDEIINKKYGDVIIIGGAEIYNLFMPYCTKIYLTKILSTVESDTVVEIDESKYEKIYESEIKNENGLNYKFIELIR